MRTRENCLLWGAMKNTFPFAIWTIWSHLLPSIDGNNNDSHFKLRNKPNGTSFVFFPLTNGLLSINQICHTIRTSISHFSFASISFWQKFDSQVKPSSIFSISCMNCKFAKRKSSFNKRQICSWILLQLKRIFFPLEFFVQANNHYHSLIHCLFEFSLFWDQQWRYRRYGFLHYLMQTKSKVFDFLFLWNDTVSVYYDRKSI